MSRSSYPHEPMSSKAGHRGLTLRLAAKRSEAIGKTTLLPFISFPQLKDPVKK